MYDKLLPNETILMPRQASPFNGDTYVEAEFLRLKEKHNINLVIELGTCVGGTTKWLAENFNKVYTVEINEEFLNIALERIDGKENVVSVLGNSTDVLPSTLKPQVILENNNILLYLDDHWNLYLPLIDELKIIAESGLKPIIVVHDCKVPNEPNLGYDSYNGVDISLETMKPYLDEIYGLDNYNYYFNSNETSTEVKRGVIYVEPK